MRLNNADGDESPSIFERAFSATPYLLPVLDSVNYSKFLAFYAPEFFNPVYAALDPLLAVYKASPFINLAIYLLIVWVGRQPTLSRFVRFNFQQGREEGREGGREGRVEGHGQCELSCADI
jgi:hypothetical protein